MERESGYYWVRDRKRPLHWTIARWDRDQGWWVVFERFIDDRDPCCTGDLRFEEIGGRVEHEVPTSATATMVVDPQVNIDRSGRNPNP